MNIVKLGKVTQETKQPSNPALILDDPIRQTYDRE